MASPGHMNIDRQQAANANLYADGNAGEHFNYGSMFSASAPGQAYEQTWNIEPGWHHNNPQHQQQSQRAQFSSANGSAPFNNNHFGGPFSSNAPSFNDPSFAFPAHGNLNSFNNSALDPSLVTTQANGGFSSNTLPFYSSASSTAATIAPAALQNNVPSKSPTPLYPAPNRPPQTFHGQSGSGASATGQHVFSVVLPKGAQNGRFLTIGERPLAEATNSTKLSNFLHIGVDQQEYPITKIGSIPAYVPRKSRNEIKTLAANDPKILAKLSKKQSKVTKHKAPKIPRPRLPLGKNEPKDAPTPSSVETSSEEDSEYSSSDDELDIIESPPIPDARPQEAFKAVSYDTVKAVWLPRRVHPSSDQIRMGLKNLWEVLKTLRDRWKSDGDALKVATEAKKQSELPMLRERVKSQRDMLEVALESALEHGHPEILALLGENRPFLQMCRLFLYDRVKDNDVDGRLSKFILGLIARCTTITSEVLEEFNLKKVLSAYGKRGNEESKKLVKRIEDNASAASKAKAEKAKQEKASEQKDKEAKAKPQPSTAPRTSTPESTAGVKRPLGGDATANQAAKRVASMSTGAAKPSTTLQKRPGSAGPDKAAQNGPASTAAKAKVQSAAKVPNMYAGLQSASKKSAAISAVVGKKTAPAADKKAPAPTAPPMATKATSAFSFSDYMRDLNKPKEPERPKDQKQELPPETEEQKAKRLRKESRRQLRVSFKEGSALAEIRYFEHEADEDSGRDANMVRDAGDVGDEGRMFKQHKDQMDIDDDDDGAEDERLVEFHAPSSVDFSTVNVDERKRNYAPYGGGENQPDSPERVVQEKHESNTLLVVYFDKADIPPSPREPADPFTGEKLPSKDFGQPPQNIVDRAAALQPNQMAPPTGQTSGAPDVSAILSAFGQQNQQPSQQQQQQAQPVQAGYQNLQNVFAQYSNASQPAPQPPAVQQAAPPAGTPDISSILASLQAHNATQQQPAQQQQPPPPQMAEMPQMPAVPQFPNMFSGTGQTPDLNAMMAMFSQAGIPPPPVPGMPGFAPPMQQQGSSGAIYEDPERKRQRETGDDGGDGAGHAKRGKWGNKKRTWAPGEKPKFVLPCKFYKEGKCLKGADCTFLHD